jgi:hypothetical protein
MSGKTDSVIIQVPGAPRMTVYPDHDRLDVEEAGYARRSGFFVRLRRGLTEGDVVSVTFHDGRHVNGSPWRYEGR